MKVFILAGGYGTRLSELTTDIPKPAVVIGNRPIIFHIMEIFSSQGYNDFVLLLGYKAEILKRYFLNYCLEHNDFEVDLANGEVRKLNNNKMSWKVTCLDTGLHTLTGGRLLKAKKLINERFFLTYGDGLGNINLNKLLKIHEQTKAIATMTAVKPPARFGELDINENNIVHTFEEKNSLNEGFINGGFFVLEPEVIDYISGFNVMLEREPLTAITKQGKLAAFRHEGFWQCMDNKREYDLLNDIANDKNISPWLNIE